MRINVKSQSLKGIIIWMKATDLWMRFSGWVEEALPGARAWGSGGQGDVWVRCLRDGGNCFFCFFSISFFIFSFHLFIFFYFPFHLLPFFLSFTVIYVFFLFQRCICSHFLSLHFLLLERNSQTPTVLSSVAVFASQLLERGSMYR